MYSNQPTSNANGNENTAVGNYSLFSNTTGYRNTAIGMNALRANTTGTTNTATGHYSLFSNSTANDNTANGYGVLFANTTGTANTVMGAYAAQFNTIGSNNTAVGFQALNTNSTAGNNIAIGYRSLYTQSFSNGGVAWTSDNVAVGYQALYNNQPTATTNGYLNTAIGTQALYANTTGYYNTATGRTALTANTTGYSNTASGLGTLGQNIAGANNTANGMMALYQNNGDNNTAMGYNALYGNITGSNNTALGYNAYPNGWGNGMSNSMALGANAIINGLSNKVRIGDATVTIIEGQVAYTFPSDGRFKNNVTEEVKGLDFINRLRPIVYNFDTRKFDAFLMKTMSDSLRDAIMNSKDYSESSSIRQSGFIAQEVEQAAQESGYNFNGIHKPANENDNYSIAYSLFVVPIVKGIQELNAKNEKLENKIANLEIKNEEQEKINQKLQKEIDELILLIKK
jgi:hypothetical protein